MNEELIFLKVAEINSAEEALRFLGNHLFEKQIVKESFVEAVVSRELLFPTGLQFEGYGVAIPHTDAEHVQETQIALMTLEKPVSFIQMATENQHVEVKIIVMLAIKEAHAQLEMLQKLISLLQNKSVVDEILSCSADDKKAVHKLLSTFHII